ncbi:hypothetical protein [Streptomyces phaeochromogenes]|uniref:hypothetical protein n=1 Tax=Streptomyces phaeochromogenes TaxID=1923 RepID=UPI003870B45E|nr:hypothetical protein OG277_00495 [Streptomyces phaeochromogenes]
MVIVPAVSRPAPTAIGGAGEVELLPAAFCALRSCWLTGTAAGPPFVFALPAWTA